MIAERASMHVRPNLPRGNTKQHRRVGTVAEILDAMWLQDARKKALENL